MKEPYYQSKLSGCCGATTHIDKGGIGIFSLTQSALICDGCGKYTYYKIKCDDPVETSNHSKAK